MRIMVVGVTRLYRQGVAALLASQPGVDVVACEQGGVTAAVRASELHPDVVLLDMADPAAGRLARRLLAAVPDLAVVGMGVPDEESQVVRCAVAGLAAYVPAAATVDDVVDTLRRVEPGQSLRPAGIAAVLTEAALPGAAHLTAREAQIVDLLDQSLSNKEIAQRLGITVSTVKNHVHNLLGKLGARRRSQAAAWLRDLGDAAPGFAAAGGSRSRAAR